jgi:hypothetical protein
VAAGVGQQSTMIEGGRKIIPANLAPNQLLLSVFL